MPPISIAELPDEARIWLFAAARPLTPEQQETLRSELSRFIEQWTSHERPVGAAYDIVDDTFVLVGVDHASEMSGCGIDKLFRKLAELERTFDLPLTDSSRATYRDESGAIRSLPRYEFTRRAASGDLHPQETFDITVERLGAFRRGDWISR